MTAKIWIWLWAIGAVMCAVSGIVVNNYIQFASAALCAFDTYRWYQKYYL